MIEKVMDLLERGILVDPSFNQLALEDEDLGVGSL
jgi:hypothetical protein